MFTRSVMLPLAHHHNAIAP